MAVRTPASKSMKKERIFHQPLSIMKASSFQKRRGMEEK